MKVLSDLPVLCGKSPLPLSGCGSMSVGPFLASPSHASGSALPCLPSGAAPTSTGTRHACSCSSRVFVSSTPLPEPWTTRAAGCQPQGLAASHPGPADMPLAQYEHPSACQLPLRGLCCPQPPQSLPWQIWMPAAPATTFPPPPVSQQPLEGQRASALSL